MIRASVRSCWQRLRSLRVAALRPVPSESHADHQTPAAPAARADAAVRINTAAAPGPPPKGMVWIPGGTFWMGCEGCGMPDALPAHLVEVDGFWMDRAPVTNAEFERFVTATGYVTVAERPLDAKDFPGVPKEMLDAGVGGVRTHVAARAARQSSAVVALHAGRELETSGRPGQRSSRSRRSSRRAHRVRRRAGVREVGRQAAADRSRVRVRRARRARSESVSVGQRADARATSPPPISGRARSPRKIAAKTGTRARRR